MHNKPAQHQINIRRTALRLALAGVFMFGFAFALIPLYNMLCDTIGLNGNTAGVYEYDPARAAVDTKRLIKIEFLTNKNASMPWRFRAAKDSIRIHPGELKTATFYVQNPTDQVMIGQAVPNISPSPAAQYFHKTECFCFEQQTLQPGESLEMPLRFLVDLDLPSDIKTITLSYTIFDVTERLSINNTLRQSPQVALTTNQQGH